MEMKRKTRKRYPKSNEDVICKYAFQCPYGKQNPRIYARRFPRYYGKRAKCALMNIYKCPFEKKYSKSRRYDEKWPYPHPKYFR